MAPLSKALERPVRLNGAGFPGGGDSFEWTLGTPVKETIDAWTLWQNDPFVKNKLANFAYLRCNLHVKIVQAASPFHYGKLMINYIPYGNDNQVFFQNWNTLFSAVAAGTEESVIQYFSTYPMTSYLDAAENNSVEFVLPFIYHYNYINIADTTKKSLGLLNMLSMNDLRRANPNAEDIVRISAFAWATDIELVMPTELLPTSGKSVRKYKVKATETEECEANDGIVSSPASAVASIAGRLTDIPFIGPFAKATQIGANATAGIARIFGFSNPPLQQNPQPRVLKLYRNLATTIGEDTAIKLSMDPQQELSIDPRLAGISNNDDMVISSIVQREQWLAKSAWRDNVGQFASPLEQVLFIGLVSPFQVRTTGTFGAAPIKQAHQLNPAGHVARLFKYWRGSIIYRIEVVASKYHSGTLQIQFDPSVGQTITNAEIYTPEINKRQTIIMDITKVKDIEIEIDYVHTKPFLKVRNIGFSTMDPMSFNSTATPQVSGISGFFDPDYDMGILTVSIVNALVAPGDTSLPPNDNLSACVDINVFQRCGADMVFSQPNTGWEQDTFTLTSGHAEWSKSVLADANKDNVELASCFGERVVSLRSILKRPTVSQFNVVNSAAPSGAGQVSKIFLPHFPPQVYYNGFLNRQNTYETYLSPAFLMKKGGIRWKTYFFGGNSTVTDPNGFVGTARMSSDTTVAGVPTVATNDAPTRNSLLSTFVSGSTGMEITDLKYRPVIDVESPFYSNSRFALACWLDQVDSSFNIAKNPAMDEILYLEHDLFGFGSGAYKYVVHCSVGEDYNLMGYQAPPTIWTFS